MTVCIFLGKYLGNYLIIVYFTTKALFITNAVCQIFLLNLFLGQEFHLFGIQVLKRIFEGRGWDTQSRYFPKVTLCDFQIREVLHPRDSHRYTVQCVLPLNLFSQQVKLKCFFLFHHALFFIGILYLDFYIYLVLVYDGFYCRMYFLLIIKLINEFFFPSQSLMWWFG
jgi:hypothetical protein